MARIEFFPGSDQFIKELDGIFDDPAIIAECHEIFTEISIGYEVTYKEIQGNQLQDLDVFVEIMKKSSNRKEFCRICLKYVGDIDRVQINGRVISFQNFIDLICK